MTPPRASSPPAKGQRLPAVDERLVAPEAHAEILDGRVYRTMGAPPYTRRSTRGVTHVFVGVLADGYDVAVDMLTRADDESDAAPDVSVFPAAPDPVTGGRQLEEIALKMLDSERLSHTTAMVEKFARRGVRRLFAVRVATRAVYEWDHAHHDWTELDAGAEITDRCLRVPLPVAALVDRVLADDTVARALLASRNRVLERALDEREARGKAEGLRAAIAVTLSARGVALDAEDHARIDGESRHDVLARWLTRAVRVDRTSDLFAA